MLVTCGEKPEFGEIKQVLPEESDKSKKMGDIRLGFQNDCTYYSKESNRQSKYLQEHMSNMFTETRELKGTEHWNKGVIVQNRMKGWM